MDPIFKSWGRRRSGLTVTPGISEYAIWRPAKFDGETRTVTGTVLCWSLNFGSGQAMNAASQGLKLSRDVYWLKWKTMAESGRFRMPRVRVGSRQFSGTSSEPHSRLTEDGFYSPIRQLRE